MSALPPDYKPTDAEKKALSKAQSLSSSRLDFLLVGGYAGFQVAKFAAARVVKNPALSRAVPVIMGVGGLSGAAGGLAVFREYQFRTLVNALPQESELRHRLLEKRDGRLPSIAPQTQQRSQQPPQIPQQDSRREPTHFKGDRMPSNERPFAPAPQSSIPPPPFELPLPPIFSTHSIDIPAPAQHLELSYDAEPFDEEDPYLSPPPAATTSWAKIRSQNGVSGSAWDRIRRGEKMAEVRHMVDELDHETAGMDYGRRTVDVEERKDAVPKPANYVPRTREEKEELERARAIKRNAWGDPV